MRRINSIIVLLVAFFCVGCNIEQALVGNAEPDPTEPLIPTEERPLKQTALEKLLANSSKPAVIKFYADWCTTCKDYNPSYEAIKAELASQVDFYEINIDKKKDKPLVRQLRVARIPETFFISQDRKNVYKELGPVSKDELRELIKTKLLTNI